MKVYTKTGDRGVTSLYSGQRVPKDHARVDVYGTMDEASAAMGLAKSLTNNETALSLIHRLQQEIFDVNADFATEPKADVKGGEPRYRINDGHLQALEQIIDDLEAKRIPQKGFVIPGASQAGAALDLARTIVRRAERAAVSLAKFSDVHPPVMIYLNRLSDLLFVLARYVDQEEMVSRVTREVVKAMQGQEDGTMLEKAKKMIAAAEAKADAIGVPMVITVVDEGGNLVAQHRMDGALLASIAISRDKAYTSVALKMTTETASKLAQPGEMLYGLNTTDGSRLVVFGGGLPIVDNGRIIGAIGVSGGSVEQDVSVAEAGLAAW
ncbi:cob(I)yrinic acid a,c-diamide adenosyltransferase [Heliobacillus mobilis]|nr:cob(I)yrinic acid a,c-diamide adenosyltransferase [Heliobacterium mobile]MTV47985.1 cob(I)yrinic acid a,c-diamide adenosyltransferase [Heliobacterium mobile]